MKSKDLIEELQKFDQDLDVVINEIDGFTLEVEEDEEDNKVLFIDTLDTEHRHNETLDYNKDIVN